MPGKPNYQLKENSIDVWLCQAEKMDKKVDYFFSILSSDEKERANRFKFGIHRQRFIISHGFKRTILAEYLSISPLSIDIIKAEKGKPYLSDPIQSLQFNLSHTEDVTLLAITKAAEIGIDIECSDRKTDWEAICHRFYTPVEQNELLSLDKNKQKNAFFGLWTRKEAYIKMLGTGLSLSPTEFTLTVPPSPPSLIKHHSQKYPTKTKVSFADIELPNSLNSYFATLASEANILKYNLYQYQ